MIPFNNFLKNINPLLRIIPIFFFSTTLTGCLVFGKYPEKPKPIENAVKLKVCKSNSMEIVLNTKYFEMGECNSSEEKFKSNYEISFEKRNEKYWSPEILLWTFILSVGILPTAELQEGDNVFTIKNKINKKEENISIHISKDSYYWLPLFPWAIAYHLKDEEDKYKIETYSELVYKKFKSFYDSIEKEEKENADNQQYFIENLFKNIQKNIPQKNIYNLDYLACSKEPKNCQSSIDFDMAYFNDKENQIFNSTNYKEDQFKEG